ncbi:hypothetical protein BVZ31_05760 [Alcaligenes faecalis]|uniref:hypothetical protein n=1 Tax=Alcaligenes faecalis TaxID=511 RepID=UPI000A2D2FE3|nr:hypothetical protein [Alcaligenes faecalis]OSZ46187.1 hypothetical protein BVZ30_04325 [Alcaligenes faecalis]OSZ51133.1 hypothetical protein BVZ31_05760 [Alcaligenes faecalis]OSZ53578.1 hypothetical protein BVZ32_09055 [Alcaligenes faecalis]
MVTDAQRDIISAAAPLLASGSKALTTYFYELILRDSPPISPLVSQIANNHLALQIQPEHDPFVDTCQLQAIREELIPRMTSNELIDGWAAAYQQLSNLLIEAERLIYDDMALTSGGLADRPLNQE